MAVASLTQENLKRLLGGYIETEGIEQKLYQTEMRNLGYFGYGIKGFALSMIETAAASEGEPGYFQLDHLGQLPALIDNLLK